MLGMRQDLVNDGTWQLNHCHKRNYLLCLKYFQLLILRTDWAERILL
jgi:hypothetical protein